MLLPIPLDAPVTTAVYQKGEVFFFATHEGVFIKWVSERPPSLHIPAFFFGSKNRGKKIAKGYC